MKITHAEASATITHLIGAVKLTVTAKAVRRFWSKVNKNGPTPEHRPELGPCWVWTAGLNDRGYGQFSLAYKTCHAHRVAYSIVNGSCDPALFLCHDCDNPTCVNPGHMFLGTQKDNMEDRDSKGRSARLVGEQCGASKLTDIQAREIKVRYAAGGITMEGLAKDYGVVASTVWTIVHEANWKHIHP